MYFYLSHSFAKVHFALIYLTVYCVSLVVVDAVGTSKWFHNQDNCTLTVAGRCKPIDSFLKQNCLGTPLPYDFTSEDPILEDVTHFDLQTWTALKAIPTCWDKLQIFLCTVYVPECRVVTAAPPSSSASTSGEFAEVVLPEQGMCLAVHKACPHLFAREAVASAAASNQHLSGGDVNLLGDFIPRFLQCDLYAPVCRKNKLRPKIFYSNKSTCQAPLVSTSDSRNWIKGIATCAFPCRSPVYRPEHYDLARSLVFAAAVTGILLNLCVLLTLRLLRSPSAPPPITSPQPLPSATPSKPPTKASPPPPPPTFRSCHTNGLPHTALSVIHVAFLVACLGLLVPRLPGVGDAVACRADGSVRVGEPQTQAGSPILCVVSFMLVYMPLLAIALWSNVLDYALFSAYHASASRIPGSGGDSPHPSSGLSVAFLRLRRLRRPPKQPTQLLLLPPDSCEVPKKLLVSGGGGGDGVNVAMEGSMSPASPATATASQAKAKNTELVDLTSAPQQTWITNETDQSGSLVPRLLYDQPPLIGCPLTNHEALEVGDPVIGSQPHSTFNSPQITCIHIAGCAVPVVFALISLTASEIDGEPLSGLCLVGIRTLWAYCSMVMVPLIVCLLLKVVYLGRAMRCIRKLAVYLRSSSYSPVDREMSQRLNSCFRAYLLYILTLVGLLAFSVGVHTYTYVGMPKWLETQRQLIFCQLRRRLMGMDAVAASAVCQAPFSADLSYVPAPQQEHFSTNATMFRGGAVWSQTTTSSTPGLEEEEVEGAVSPPRDTGSPLSTTTAEGPLIGPLILNLLTHLMFNLVFASMCLLDESVKRKWCGLLRRIFATITTPCRTRATTTTVTAISHKFSPTQTANFDLPPAFSWWDPGLFFHACHDSRRRCHDCVETEGLNGGPMGEAQQPPPLRLRAKHVATSDVSCGCNRRYSSSTNDEGWMISSIGGAINPAGNRGAGGNASSIVSSNATTTAAAPGVGKSLLLLSKNSVNSSQSLFGGGGGGGGVGGGRQRSRCTLFNSFSSAQDQTTTNTTAAVVTAAAAAAAAVAAGGSVDQTGVRPMHRPRHRRMWSGKTSGRRRLLSRSYSTLGLANGGGAESQRSFNSLLLHHHQRAASSLTTTAAAANHNIGSSQRDLSLPSLSRLYSATAAAAAAAAIELERSRRSVTAGGGGHASRASLASAESYNSFQLLAEQAGASWRELCRTRLLLLDALNWAQAVAASSAAEQPPQQHEQAVDQQALMTSMMMAYMMGGQGVGAQVQGEGQEEAAAMVAALRAATAAAQAAMQQNSVAPPVVAATPMNQCGNVAPPPPVVAPPVLGPRSASSSLATRHSTRHDVFCHLDASPLATGIAPHLARQPQQTVVPWSIPPPPPQQPQLPQQQQQQQPLPLPPHVAWNRAPMMQPPYAFLPTLVPPPPAPPEMSSHLVLPPTNHHHHHHHHNDLEVEDEEDDVAVDGSGGGGSDAFDSEDEVMSTTSDGGDPLLAVPTAAAAKEGDEDSWDTFPTPEGQPGCLLPLAAAAASASAVKEGEGEGASVGDLEDDLSSVSQSASQVVNVAVEAKKVKRRSGQETEAGGKMT